MCLHIAMIQNMIMTRIIPPSKPLLVILWYYSRNQLDLIILQYSRYKFTKNPAIITEAETFYNSTSPDLLPLEVKTPFIISRVQGLGWLLSVFGQRK